MQARAARSQAEVRSPMRADAPHPIGMCTTMPGSHVTPMLAHNPPPTPISNPFDTLPIAGPCKTCSAPRSTATDHMVGMAAHAGGSNPFHLPSPLGTNTWFLSNMCILADAAGHGQPAGRVPALLLPNGERVHRPGLPPLPRARSLQTNSIPKSRVVTRPNAPKNNCARNPKRAPPLHWMSFH